MLKSRNCYFFITFFHFRYGTIFFLSHLYLHEQLSYCNHLTHFETLKKESDKLYNLQFQNVLLCNSCFNIMQFKLNALLIIWSTISWISSKSRWFRLVNYAWWWWWYIWYILKYLLTHRLYYGAIFVWLYHFGLSFGRLISFWRFCLKVN